MNALLSLSLIVPSRKDGLHDLAAGAFHGNTKICLVQPRMEVQSAKDGEEVRMIFEEQCFILTV